MLTPTYKSRHTLPQRVLCGFVAFAFTFGTVVSPGYAQTVFTLPAPGMMVSTSAAFTPALINGIIIHPENPLEFDFVIGTGDQKLSGKAFEEESTRLIKYFLASLTVPEDQMWVNLSPYEKDRIIPNGFGTTEMGRDLLAQDYILKQLTASLMYPEKELGKKFWDKIYKQAREKYGTTEIPVNTFNKVWIVPEKAVVYEHENSAFVVKSHLKVMLEEDYMTVSHQSSDVSRQKNDGLTTDDRRLMTQIIREIIIPALEKEVNEGQTFANLRQIYNSTILAAWFKQNLKQTLLGQVYVDKTKTKGVDTQDKTVNQKIYAQYLEAFKKGVYNYIKEDYDPATKEVIPRKYFSGGTSLKVSDLVQTYKDGQPLTRDQQEIVGEYLASLREYNQGKVKVQLAELDEDTSFEAAQQLVKQIQTLQGTDLSGTYVGAVPAIARNPVDDDALREFVENRLKKQGFDPALFIMGEAVMAAVDVLLDGEAPALQEIENILVTLRVTLRNFNFAKNDFESRIRTAIEHSEPRSGEEHKRKVSALMEEIRDMSFVNKLDSQAVKDRFMGMMYAYLEQQGVPASSPVASQKGSNGEFSRYIADLRKHLDLPAPSDREQQVILGYLDTFLKRFNEMGGADKEQLIPLLETAEGGTYSPELSRYIMEHAERLLERIRASSQASSPVLTPAQYAFRVADALGVSPDKVMVPVNALLSDNLVKIQNDIREFVAGTGLDAEKLVGIVMQGIKEFQSRGNGEELRQPVQELLAASRVRSEFISADGIIGRIKVAMFRIIDSEQGREAIAAALASQFKIDEQKVLRTLSNVKFSSPASSPVEANDFWPRGNFIFDPDYVRNLARQFNAPEGQRGIFEALFKDGKNERGLWVRQPWLIKGSLLERIEQDNRSLREDGVKSLGFLGMGGESSIVGPSDDMIINLSSTAPGKSKRYLEGKTSDDLRKIRWYIVSKSGGTAETKTNAAYLEKVYQIAGLDPRAYMSYVTDPGTEMEKDKKAEGFQVKHRELIEDLDEEATTAVGGRNTLVNYPTLIAESWRHPGGLKNMLEAIKTAHTYEDAAIDPWIAAALAVARAIREYGKHKLAIIQPESIRQKRWLHEQQNPEESLGKTEFGFTTFTTRPDLSTLKRTQDDGWVFVEFRVDGMEAQTQAYVQAARAEGHMVITIPVKIENFQYAMFAPEITAYGWMKFVAVLGGMWGINFSDQPPVEEYKRLMRAKNLDLNDAILPAQAVQAVAEFEGVQLVFDGLLNQLDNGQKERIRSMQAQGQNAARIYAELLRMTRDTLDVQTLAYYDDADEQAEAWIEKLTQNVLHEDMGYAAKWGEGTGVLHGLFVNWFSGPKHQIPTHIVATEHAQPVSVFAEGAQLLKAGAVAAHLSLVKAQRPSVMLVVEGKLDERGRGSVQKFYEAVATASSPVMTRNGTLARVREIIISIAKKNKREVLQEEEIDENVTLSAYAGTGPEIFNELQREFGLSFSGREDSTVRGIVDHVYANKIVDFVVTDQERKDRVIDSLLSSASSSYDDQRNAILMISASYDQDTEEEMAYRDSLVARFLRQHNASAQGKKIWVESQHRDEYVETMYYLGFEESLGKTIKDTLQLGKEFRAFLEQERQTTASSPVNLFDIAEKYGPAFAGRFTSQIHQSLTSLLVGTGELRFIANDLRKLSLSVVVGLRDVTLQRMRTDRYNDAWEPYGQPLLELKIKDVTEEDIAAAFSQFLEEDELISDIRTPREARRMEVEELVVGIFKQKAVLYEKDFSISTPTVIRKIPKILSGPEIVAAMKIAVLSSKGTDRSVLVGYVDQSDNLIIKQGRKADLKWWALVGAAASSRGKLLLQKNINEGIDPTEIRKIVAAFAYASSPVTESRQTSDVSLQTGLKTDDGRLTTAPGGIDLNPALLDLQIKRDGNGVPLPLPMQPIKDMHIEGFLPVIINVTPVTNLPLLLGLADTDTEQETVETEPAMKAREPEQVSYLN